jgi:uncharacterized cupredoxin-like copper-binding protein
MAEARKRKKQERQRERERARTRRQMAVTGTIAALVLGAVVAVIVAVVGTGGGGGTGPGSQDRSVGGEGILIAPEEATREVTIEAGDRGDPAGNTSFFNPNAFSMKTAETLKVNVKNTGTQSHNLRVKGADQEYETADDFVTWPVIILPGNTGFAVVRIEQPGQYAFRCDIHRTVQFGTLTVQQGT